jgi:hypothetical protein
MTGALIQNAYSDRLFINAKLATYSAVEVGNENGIVTLDLTPRILYDPTTDDVINALLINQAASYLV